jgi:TPR repeat protein
VTSAPFATLKLARQFEARRVAAIRASVVLLVLALISATPALAPGTPLSRDDALQRIEEIARQRAALNEAQAFHERGEYATEFRLLHPLAEQGNPEAQELLGGMYTAGNGVLQDYAEAVRWFRMAAEQGFAEAMDDLARMYVHGQGVPKNYVQAHMWFNLAAARYSGDPLQNYHAGARDNLAEEMTPEQVAQAQGLAREWQSQHPQLTAWRPAKPR